MENVNPMKQPNIDAEMGLDIYGRSPPADWISRILDRLRSSSRWRASQVEIGIEDDVDSDRSSVAEGLKLEREFRVQLTKSSQCSCFLTVDDSTATWSLPLMFTREAGNTTLTASIYDEDLRSHGPIWRRVRALLKLAVDLLMDETTEWLRFGIEGQTTVSSDSPLVIMLSEPQWYRIVEESRVALLPVTEEFSGFRVIWCSPPGRMAPEDFGTHISLVNSVIMSS